jgi:virginiamycin B lyase
VVVAIALVVVLFVFVGLPAIGCPKASSPTAVGAVSDYCFAPFTSGHTIGGTTAGPDGNLWFTESTHIGRLTPQGAFSEFARPDSESNPGAIVAGADGNLWFIEQSNKSLGRITPQGVVTQFPLPPGATSPLGLAAGPDGALWYTRLPTSLVIGGGPPDLETPGSIGRMTVDGKATEFTLPTPPAPRPPAQPRDIVAGPDGALWFDTGMVSGVDNGNSWIGRISTSGQASIVYAPDPKALVSIAAIGAGPDDSVWFTQASDNLNTVGTPGGPPSSSPPSFSANIGRLSPSGAVTLFAVPASLGAAPGAIVAGTDGNLWFAAGKMGRITPSGQVTAYALPDSNAEIGTMTKGPGNAVWFVQSYGDTDLVNGWIWGTKIGRIQV